MIDRNDPQWFLLENVSALSAVFHRDKRFQAFYDRYAAQLSGFVGIWSFVAYAAEIFTAADRERGGEWDGEWPQAIEDYAHRIYVHACDGVAVDDLGSDHVLKPLAVSVLAHHLTR